MAQGKTASDPRRPVAESKKRMVELVAQGHTVKNAVSIIGRSIKSYESWRATDPDFCIQMDRARSVRLDEWQHEKVTDIAFPEFSETYLGHRVFPHMMNVVDMIEGQEPSWLHDSMTYRRGEKDLVICNMPPEHGKSSSITMNYVAYRIAKDPNIRVMIVSKTQTMARKFLFGIKDRLTHDRYSKMQRTFGPPNGYASGSASWTQDIIYVSGEARDSGEKDPTVQALGIRGHIYGARADLIILDNVIDGTNAHDYEKQIEWIQSEVISRLSPSGSLLVVGTRLASKDLYLELQNPDRYPDEESPWSYLAMPAVLEFHDKAEDWVTLWPASNTMEIGAKGDDTVPDEDGLYVKWNGERLSKKRNRMAARTWSMVYMQSQVNEEAIFQPAAVAACINGARTTGLMPSNVNPVRKGRGMEGTVVVAGLDPATSGHTAAVVLALDPMNQKRHVLNVFNKAGARPDEIRDLIKEWTDHYGIAEWRIEKNGFQGFLVHDADVNQYLATRGVRIQGHFTGNNKHDADFGVASMTMLLSGYESGTQLLELPSTQFSEGVKALVEQLVTWGPSISKTQKTDCVMAMWFAELACRDRVIAHSTFGRTHAVNPFLTEWDRAQQTSVNLTELEMNGALMPVTGRLA